MCNLYNTPSGSVFTEHFRARWRRGEVQLPDYVAPDRYGPVVLLDGGERVADLMRWGLVLGWAEAKKLPRPNNARSDKLLTSAFYRESFRARRCLIPVASFVEWQGPKGKKVRTVISAPDRAPLVMAGLWAEWTPPDAEPVHSYTMVTCGASDWMRRVHDRMPVILDGEGQEAWLHPETPERELLALVRPFEGELAAEPAGG